jgi:hypothetical protein
MSGPGAKDSYGAGFAMAIVEQDSSSKAGFEWSFRSLPKGRTFTFGPNQALSDTFRLRFRAEDANAKPDLAVGHFLIRGSWNTNESPGVLIKVGP